MAEKNEEPRKTSISPLEKAAKLYDHSVEQIKFAQSSMVTGEAQVYYLASIAACIRALYYQNQEILKRMPQPKYDGEHPA